MAMFVLESVLEMARFCCEALDWMEVRLIARTIFGETMWSMKQEREKAYCLFHHRKVILLEDRFVRRVGELFSFSHAGCVPARSSKHQACEEVPF